MTDLYLWLRFGHFVGLICWMAGLFYLPRLFVYHMEAPPEMSSVFEVMERRLYRYIIVPSSFTTWICGISLVLIKQSWQYNYFYIKLSCLIAMLCFQFALQRYMKRLLSERISSKFFRVINEIPTLLLLIIVYCAIFKPFLT